MGLTSDQAVMGSLFLSSTILLLEMVMNYFLRFDVYSFVIEDHLVEWLFQLKVYTSLNIV